MEYDDALRKRLDEIMTSGRSIPKIVDTVQTKGGLSWKNLAKGFCSVIMKKMAKDGTNVVSFTERLMREMIGDPNNWTFRKHCKELGFKISKDRYTKSIRIENINRAEHGPKV